MELGLGEILDRLVLIQLAFGVNRRAAKENPPTS